MSFNWKRIALLIGFIAAVILFGYLLYYFFLKPAAPTTPPTNENANAPGVLPSTNGNANIPVGTEPGLLPPGATPTSTTGIGVPATQPISTVASSIANGNLTQTKALISGQASGTSLAADGSNLIYYDQGSGQFNRVTADGKISLLSDQVFYQVQGVTWSPNRNQAILEYPDGANILYNFTDKKQITLPAHWKDFSYAPIGDQIAFKSMGASTDNRWLAIANSDGSKAQKIEHLGDKDSTVYVNWSPNNQIIATYSEDKNTDQQNLFFVGLHGENFKSMVIDGRDFRSQWSTRGDRLLYSVYNAQNGNRPTLWVANAQGSTIGQNRQDLKLETWADKCTFATNDAVYCAVPTSLSDGAGIFPDNLDTASDDIYKIDLTTGFKSRIAIPQGDPTITQLMASSDGRYLYYTDKKDGKIYQLRLR